ncbi:hypothetical protein [Micromonospora profundi]|uniref:hypothetical protein n=1 Tax=Micromonospora profundi TaxID=1420889 RepID=UPI00381A0D96
MTTYPAKKKIGNLGAVGIAAAISVLLCCGVGTIGALTTDDSDKKPTAAATQTAPTASDRLAEDVSATPDAPPSTIPEPAASSPTPGPQDTSGEPTPRPIVKPTTTKPKPKTTTAAPKPKATTAAPKPKPTTAKPKPPSVATVHPGSFCSKQGARGVTKTGKPMVCTTTATDSKKRWRAA